MFMVCICICFVFRSVFLYSGFLLRPKCFVCVCARFFFLTFCIRCMWSHYLCPVWWICGVMMTIGRYFINLFRGAPSKKTTMPSFTKSKIKHDTHTLTQNHGAREKKNCVALPSPFSGHFFPRCPIICESCFWFGHISYLCISNCGKY